MSEKKGREWKKIRQAWLGLGTNKRRAEWKRGHSSIVGASYLQYSTLLSHPQNT